MNAEFDFNDPDDVESRTEDSNDANGISFVAAKLAPYLDKPEDCDIMKERLVALGVQNMSDIKYLNLEKDMEDLIKPISCRRFQAEILKELNDNNNNASDSIPKAKVLSHYEIPRHLFSGNLKAALESSARLPKDKRLEFVRLVGGHLYDLSSHQVTKALCEVAAKILVQAYPRALEGKHYGKGYEDLQVQLANHIKYLKEKDKLRGPPGAVNTAARRKSSKEQYGMDSERFLPNALPDGETTQSQMEKKVALQHEFSLGDIKWKKVEKLMMETYPSQRASIAENLNMEQLLKEWPFIGKYKFLKRHFHYLMKLDEKECVARLTTLIPKMIKFIRAEAESKRRGKSAAVVTKLVDILKRHDEHEPGPKIETLAVILGIGALLSIDMKQVFLMFDESTSFDEIEASDRLPSDGKPIIGVLGSHVLDEPKCVIIVDKRIIYREFLHPTTALLGWFKSFYLFKILYPTHLAPILEFFQRSIFKIEDERRGSRTERKKGKSTPAAIQPKYQGMMRRFDDYCGKWSL